jgi:hypothetical protein
VSDRRLPVQAIRLPQAEVRGGNRREHLHVEGPNRPCAPLETRASGAGSTAGLLAASTAPWRSAVTAGTAPFGLVATTVELLSACRASPLSSALCESLRSMLREFDARLQKGDNPGAWTCVVMDDVPELFGTRGLVKIRGAIDGEPFTGALMAKGDGTHRLPVRAALRKAIGKEAGDTVHVRIDQRID